jgi:hypothetical protein
MFRDAGNILKIVLKMDPNYHPALVHMAEVLDKLGNDTGAYYYSHKASTSVDLTAAPRNNNNEDYVNRGDSRPDNGGMMINFIH